jgi:hypothetical protein
MADTRKALQGNSSTPKQLAEGEEAGKVSKMAASLANAATGNAQGIMSTLAQGYNRFTSLRPAVAHEILKMGMSRDPAMITALAEQGMERAARAPVRRAAIGQGLIGGNAAFNGPTPTAPDPNDPYSAFPLMGR